MVRGTRASAPAGKLLDEQMQLVYERVRQNGSMGVSALAFVAQHFNISYDTVERVCKKYHQGAMIDPSFSLTFPQFTQIMREALVKTGGGDLDRGMADKARDLSRNFVIYDATTCTTSGSREGIRAMVPKKKPAKEVEDSTWGPLDDNSNVRIELLSSRGRTPLDTGLVTPRRLKTASFLPTTSNLTWCARQLPAGIPRELRYGTRLHGDAHILFPNVPHDVPSSYGSGHKKFFLQPGSLDDTWKSEYMHLGKFYTDGVDFSTAGEYVSAPKFSVHRKFETEANEIGRVTRRLSTGQLDEPPVRHPADPRAWGKLGEDHRPIQTAANFMDASAGVESVIFRARQTIIDRGWTRFDVSAPFAHYDLHGSGLISVAHSMAAMAELGEKVSIDIMEQLLVATGALLDKDCVAYDRLVDALTNGGKRLEIVEDDAPLTGGTSNGADGGEGKMRPWPDDMRVALQILHSKVAHRHIPSLPFMAEIISNDAAFKGTCDAAVFFRIMTSAGIFKDHADALIRNFKSGKNLVNYKELIRVLEDYSSESQKQNVIYKANRKYLRDKKLQAASKDQKSIVENFKDPAQRNRAALEAIHAKISSKIMHAGDLRLAFEKYDVSRRGRITYDFFVKALAQFGVDLEELEAKTLYKSMDINGEGSFEYGRFIAMVFPPRTKTGRKVIPMGFKASQHTSSNMSTADQLRHVQKCVEKALAKGPRELQRVLGIFRLPGDQDIDHSSLKMMLLDFGLTLTDAQTFALIRYLDPSAKSCIGYYKLISGILPSDCVLEQKGGGSAPSQHHHKPGQKMSDSDFHHDIVARIKRQITRKGPSGVPVGNQLRDVLSEFLCLDDVGPVELKRAFVGVGILIDDADLSRLMSLYRSPSHPKMRLSKLIEDIDDKAFDYVFSTGNVAGASLQRIQKEVPAPNESDALTRNKLRRVLKKRMDIDGAKSVVTVLRLHDLDRTGRLTSKQMQAALFSLGLKVESELNMQRLWGALANGLGSGSQATSLDILSLADLLNRGAERVARPVPNESPRQEFVLG